MPKFDYLDVMNREEFHLPTSKDINEFYNRKPELDEIPYTFIENPAECCCYIRCSPNDMTEEICQYMHLTKSRYRIKFRYVILLQGFRIRCPPGFSLPTPTPPSTENPTASLESLKVYVKLKAVAYDCGFVIQLQSISPKREKQFSRTSLSSVFGISASTVVNNAICTPCCGVMSCWGKNTEIDNEDGLVTLNSKLGEQNFAISSHPSLVTDWNNDDLHPNSVLFVFLKKFQMETYERTQIWNLQYFAPGKCKNLEGCDCLLCEKHLSRTTIFCKGHMTQTTPKSDVYYIRNGLSLSCQSENVIYLITCKQCGLQYVGKSKSRMSTKFEEHLAAFQDCHQKGNVTNITSTNVNKKLLYTHFREHSATTSGDSLENVSVVIIDQISPVKHQQRTSINKLRQYWINRLDTFNNGLNGKTPPNKKENVAGNHSVEKKALTQDNNNNDIIVQRFLEGLESRKGIVWRAILSFPPFLLIMLVPPLKF